MHPLLVLLYRIGILLLAFLFLRIAFLIYNYAALGKPAVADIVSVLAGGFRFDASILAYINALVAFLHMVPLRVRFTACYDRMLKWLFYLLNVPFLLLAVADMVYFPFTLKRITSDVTGMTVDLVDQLSSYIAGFWYVLPLVALLVALLELLYRRGPSLRIAISEEQSRSAALTPRSTETSARWNAVVGVLVMLPAAGLWVVAARGGFQVKPLSPINAAAYAGAQLAPAVTNTPFTFMHSLTKARLPERRYVDPETAESLFPIRRNTGVYRYARLPATAADSSAGGRPYNVVIIVLESFSHEYLERFGNTHRLTPFLDSLYRVGFGLDNAFANGKHSNEGIPAVFASLPTLMDESFISSVYQQNDFNGIGTLLRRVGYSTAFFHGAHNGTFNFDRFAQRAGFDRYYGKDEYPNQADYDGQWGIWDEPYLQYVSNVLSHTPEPFCAGVFTVSSHFPFNLPEPYKTRFKGLGTHPLHPCIRYTDLALQRFFESASRQSWFNNTLFVVTSDHTSQADAPMYLTPLGAYRIPTVFYAPRLPHAGARQRAAMQVDIMPSVLHLLDYRFPFVAFGQSVFDTASFSLAYQYRSGIFQANDDSLHVQFDGSNVLGWFNYKRDPLLDNPLTRGDDDLLNRLKAVIQQYNAAMNGNGLVVRERRPEFK